MIRHFLLAATVATGLAACGPSNRSVESIKQPELITAPMAYDVRFGDSVSLSETQMRSLDEYLGAINLAYGDRVTVDDPNPSGAAARRAAIAGVVGRYGLILADNGPITPGALPFGVARVVVTRTTITMPDCPDWRRKSNPEFSASTMSNSGCAIRGNLAEMIADPNDLISGKTYEGMDGRAGSKAIDAYRERTPTGMSNQATLSNQRGDR